MRSEVLGPIKRWHLENRFVTFRTRQCVPGSNRESMYHGWPQVHCEIGVSQGLGARFLVQLGQMKALGAHWNWRAMARAAQFKFSLYTVLTGPWSCTGEWPIIRWQVQTPSNSSTWSCLTPSNMERVYPEKLHPFPLPLLPTSVTAYVLCPATWNWVQSSWCLCKRH